MKNNTPRRHKQWLTPAECIALLHVALAHAPAMVPVLIVQLFSGLRCREAWALRWEDVIFTDSVIQVRRSKNGTSRIVSLPQNAQQWLQLYRQTNGSIFFGSPVAMTSQIRKLLRQTGLTLGCNGLRHSYATYHMHLWRHPARTAAEMGASHSLFRHVFQPAVSQAEVEAFWGIIP